MYSDLCVLPYGKVERESSGDGTCAGVEDSKPESENRVVLKVPVPKKGFLPDRSLFKEGFDFPMDRTCMQPMPEVST